MNREEIITKIKLIQAGLLKNDKKSKKRLDLIIEELKQPVTLADLLGWEEDVEYELDGDKFIIMDNKIFIRNYVMRSWVTAYGIEINRFEKLKQAKKVKQKKFYARIKGVDLLDTHELIKFYYFTKCKDGLILCSKLDKKDSQVFTKKEWEKIGINDTNADFEEVE